VKKLMLAAVVALGFATNAHALTECQQGWRAYIVPVGPGFQPMAQCGSSPAVPIGWLMYIAIKID
jgi:hypothetical protein